MANESIWDVSKLLRKLEGLTKERVKNIMEVSHVMTNSLTKAKAVRVGYGKYETKQELEEAEINAWLAIPIEERLKILGLPEDFDPTKGIKK